MGPKPKKKTKKKKGKGEEEEKVDHYNEMDGEVLQRHIEANKEKLFDAKIKRNYFQLEKDMTTEFHANTRAEIKELEAKIRNYDTDM